MYQIDIGKFEQLLYIVTNFNGRDHVTKTECYNEIERVRGVETVITDALLMAVFPRDCICKLKIVTRLCTNMDDCADELEIIINLISVVKVKKRFLSHTFFML